jgi:hypothetical protein
VTIRVAEVEAAAAIAVIDLHILCGARPAAVGEAVVADPVEDPVELRLADFEGVVVPLEAVPIVKIDGAPKSWCCCARRWASIPASNSTR